MNKSTKAVNAVTLSRRGEAAYASRVLSSASSEEKRNELKRLANRGELTPDNTIETAKNPSNPLHNEFEWDDGEAAQEHRRSQARKLISSFTITETTRITEVQFTIPEFVRNPALNGSPEQGYVFALSLKSSRQQSREFVETQLGIAYTYVVKAKAFAEILLGQADLFDDLLQKIDVLQRSIKKKPEKED